MRLDKFLKVSRLVKRRSVAKDIGDQERVSINGKMSKPSSQVKIGDTIEIEYGNRFIKVKVLKIVDSTKKDEVADMYEVLEEYKKENKFTL